MKKLLILVLALCLTSASYAVVATLDITVNGQPYTGQDVEESDIIKVVWNNANQTYGGYSGLNFDVSAGEYEADSFVKNMVPAWITNTLALSETTNGMKVAGNTSAMPHPAVWMFEFEFHVPDLPWSTIIVLDTMTGAYSGQPGAVVGPDDTWPYAELHVVPEPMTIALLGLGGLFLRRRK